MGILSQALSGRATTARPPIPHPLPLFLLSVSGWDLGRDKAGEVIALPSVHVLVPGYSRVYAVADGPVTTDLEIADIQARGRKLVPEDFPVVAFGKKCSGYLAEPYRPTTEKGQDLPPQYHDVWTRWALVDGRWVREVDAEGYGKFLRDLATWLKPTSHQLDALAAQEATYKAHTPKE